MEENELTGFPFESILEDYIEERKLKCFRKRVQAKRESNASDTNAQ